uniref:Transposase (Putative), gypsy type n=1 Tax=Tanacetum cinerariifolium TaxID=118510 RepID=A0A6L2KVM2_TANCI|nr:hypothetical protein [Tanacetum cinerariifolium]
MRAQFSKLQVSNERLSQQVDALQQQVSGEESLKAAFEDYKRQQDQMVEQRCAEMDARLDAMSIDFDEELYPHMLTTIAGRRWVIGYGLRLATIKCAKSLEMSSSQLAIPVYPEVRDPQNPWACKEEIKLADDIATNISRAEQKKRSRIVCQTHGVGSAHHVRSDRVSVSAPIVVPQGLALLNQEQRSHMEAGLVLFRHLVVLRSFLFWVSDHLIGVPIHPNMLQSVFYDLIHKCLIGKMGSPLVLYQKPKRKQLKLSKSAMRLYFFGFTVCFCEPHIHHAIKRW